MRTFQFLQKRDFPRTEMMIDAGGALETRECHYCGQDRPLNRFRQRRSGREGRHNQCRDCFAAYMRSFRERKRQKVFRDFNRKVKSPRRGKRAIESFVGEMMRSYGGARNFAATWKQCLDQAIEEGKTREALVGLNAVSRLIEFDLEDAPRREDLSYLPDEVLEAEIRRVIENILEDILPA